MADLEWTIHAQEFVNCNCAYGCPCQFNALPTHGNCSAVIGITIDRGFHGATRLDGLNAAAVFAWPGAIHEGKGAVQVAATTRGAAADSQWPGYHAGCHGLPGFLDCGGDGA